MSRKQAGTQQPIRENLQGSLPLKGNTASVTKAVKPRDDTDPGKDVNEPKPLAAGAPLHSQCRQACMEMPQSTWALRSRASRLSFCLPPSLHQKHVTLVNSYWATPFVSCQAVPFLPCTRPAFNSSSCDEPGPGSLGQAPPCLRKASLERFCRVRFNDADDADDGNVVAQRTRLALSSHRHHQYFKKTIRRDIFQAIPGGLLAPLAVWRTVKFRNCSPRVAQKETYLSLLSLRKSRDM